MSTGTKRERGLGLGWILAAPIFLCNPNFIVIDVLPDWIGYFLLCCGLSKLGELNGSVGAAVTAFRRMIWIDAAKLLAILWIFGMSVTSERTASMLLWTFVFSVLELIFVIPAYSKLFDGLTEIGYFYPNTSLFESSDRQKKKSRTDRIKAFTVFFVAAKAILTVLPEFAELTNASYDESAGTVNLYRYIGVMRMLAWIPVLVIGIIWLIRTVRYFRTVLKDRVLMDGLQEAYQRDVAPKVGLFVGKTVRCGAALVVAALCLTLDLRLDGQNCFPDFFAAVVLLLAFCVLQKRERQSGRLWIAAVLCYTAFAIAGAVADTSFFSHYQYNSLIKNEAAMQTYGVLFLLNIGKYLSLLWSLLCLLGKLRTVVERHTGSVAGRERLSEQENSMAQALQKELMGEFRTAWIGTACYVLAEIVRDLFVPNAAVLELLPWGFGLLAVGLWIRAFAALNHAIATKYMLE